MSVGELLHYRVIQEAGKSERGTQLYRANPNFWDVILQVLKIRERVMLRRIKGAHRLVGRLSSSQLREHELSTANIEVLGDLIGSAGQALELFLQKMRFDLSLARSLTIKSVKAAGQR